MGNRLDEWVTRLNPHSGRKGSFDRTDGNVFCPCSILATGGGTAADVAFNGKAKQRSTDVALTRGKEGRTQASGSAS